MNFAQFLLVVVWVCGYLWGEKRLFWSGDETFYSESRHTASEVLSDTFKVVWVCNTALCFLISYTTAGSCQISSVSFQPESHTLTHKHMQRTKRWDCTDSLPILYGNTDATSLHPSISSIVRSRHVLIQTSASTSRTTFRLLLKVRLQEGGKKPSRKWPLESCGSITSSIRSLF